MGKLFGTDGVRGVANAELTPELALSLGRAVVGVLRATEPDRDRRPLVVVGRDPRASGALLESALVAGVCSAGGDALLAGVLPTPAVAFLTRHYGAQAGAVISASHNPMPDNGIKFFGPEGFKLQDPVEDRIEAALGLADQDAPRSPRRPTGVPAPGSSRSPPSPTGRTSTPGSARPTPSMSRPRSGVPGRRSAWRTTATPTGCSPSTSAAAWSTATSSSPSPRWTSGTAARSRPARWSPP